MTWLVFGVSCLLVLAGAVSIISGAPIIQLERGWAEVISGTVALSSGGVVFALAGILMRLEAIRDTMAARSLPVPAETVTAPVTEAPVAAAIPAPVAPPQAPLPAPAPIVPPEPEPVTAAAPVDEGASQGLWKRVRRPEAEMPEPEDLRQHGFPDRALPDEAPARDGVPSVVVPAHPPAAAPAIAAAPPVEPGLRDGPAKPDDTAQIGWLERSLFKGRPPRAGGDAAPIRTEPPMADEAEPFAAVAAPPPVLPAPPPGAEPEPTPDLTSEQHGGAAVVGRYQAGSASYVMYSDGTIEVETEGGEMHRFGSMDELKAFIAQQDTPVS